MGFEVLGDYLAELVVVVQRLDLLDLTEGVKGVVVEVVDVTYVRVLHDSVGEVLHVPDAVGYPTRGKEHALAWERFLWFGGTGPFS